jgi:hypothetical protein
MSSPKKSSHQKKTPLEPAYRTGRLTPEDLRWYCNPDLFEFDSTETIQPIEGIMGQERALKALKLGVDLRHRGITFI